MPKLHSLLLIHKMWEMHIVIFYMNIKVSSSPYCDSSDTDVTVSGFPEAFTIPGIYKSMGHKNKRFKILNKTSYMFKQQQKKLAVEI